MSAAGGKDARLAGWVNDLVLGVRLAIGGGRTSRIGIARLVLGTIGVGLAVALLLVAASASNMVQARDGRTNAQYQETNPRPGVDPLEVATGTTKFHSRPVRGYYLRATGPNAPVPPGLDRVPGPGEIAVSPALADLLASEEGELLRPRFPQRIVGIIGDEGVVDPQNLTFYAGTDQLMADVYPRMVYGFGQIDDSPSLAPGLLILLLVGSVALLIPVLIFIATSARIAGAERDRRLSAMRLVGANAAQVRRIAAAESLASAGTGLLFGAALFLVFRSIAPQLRIFDTSVYVSDVTPAWWLIVLIVLAVPALSVLTAMFALRRTVIEPLGVVRMSRPVRRRLWWRLVPSVLGAALLFLGADSGVRIVAGAALLLLGVPTLLPWLLERAVARFHGGRPSLQLALRRLQADSGTPARVVSGVAVVLAGAIALQMVLAAQAENFRMAVLPEVEISAEPGLMMSLRGGGEEIETAAIKSIPGVEGVFVKRQVGISAGREQNSAVTIVDCETLRVLAGVNRCVDGDVFLGDSRAYGETFEVRPGQTLSIVDPMRGANNEPSIVSQWKLPEKLTPMAPKARSQLFSYGYLFATPGALRGVTLPADTDTTAQINVDASRPDVLEHIRNSAGPMLWQVNVYTINTRESLSREQQEFSTIRGGLLAGSLFTLLLAGVSLLVLALEHMRERRRSLAALAATGVPIATLARSLLWQNVVPVLLALAVAVATGFGLAALVFRLMNEQSFTVDWATVGVFSGAAAALVLLVTALTLPSLRSVTRLTSLRTE